MTANKTTKAKPEARRLPLDTLFMYLLAALLVLPLLFIAPASHAQNDEKPPEKTKKTQAISAKVYEKLVKAQEAAEAKQYNQAISILDAIVAKDKKLAGYDAASVWNVYGFVYYSQERYKQAINAYRKVISQGEIPEALEVGTKYTIAQLYFVLEDYPAAIRAMQEWFKVANNPGPDPYILVGQAHFQVKNYDAALREVKKGMAVAAKREIKPKEHWYLLLRVLYYEKNDYRNTAKTLEALVRGWPKREYWVQLAGMYGELKQEKKQLVAMETAYVQGMLQREGELLNMAYLFLGSDMPYKAAKVVEKGISDGQIKGSSKNYELLGNAWRQAQNTKKAIPALENAAKTSEKGEIYARLANVYLDNEEYSKSISAGKRAISKGGVKRKDMVHMVVGMAQFNAKQHTAAVSSFRNCAKDKRSKKACSQWVGFVQRDQARIKQLNADLKALKDAQESRKKAKARDAA